MREQQKQRQQRHQQNRFHPVPAPVPARALDLDETTELKVPEEVAHLKRQLADQGAIVDVLQEDHDRLLLHNARLQNMMDEMRTKIRIQHAYLGQPHPQRQESRSTILRPEVDKDLSSYESLSSLGGDGPLAATQLSLNHHHEALSITPSSYLDLPTVEQSGKKVQDDETSSCDSSWNSTRRHHQQQMGKKPVASVVG